MILKPLIQHTNRNLNDYVVVNERIYLVSHNGKQLHIYAERDLTSLYQIEGLFDLTNLKSLSIVNCKLSSLQGINNLKNLRELDIRYNCIEDVSPLLDCNKLRKLDFHQNPIINLKILQKVLIFVQDNKQLCYKNKVKINIIKKNKQIINLWFEGDTSTDKIASCIDETSFYTNNKKNELGLIAFNYDMFRLMKKDCCHKKLNI